MAAEAQAADPGTDAGLPVVLAALSGVPGLVYQVVWTREVALLAGSQVESIAVVLVAYFGGLALGARLLGPLADRSRRPLILYGALEIGAGLLALAAGALVWGARERGFGFTGEAGALVLGAALIAPATFLLGGTLPALVRCAAPSAALAARAAGRIVGANTGGAVAGVAVAAASIPALGLGNTLLGAAAASGLVGLLALLRAGSPARPGAPRAAGPAGVPPALLAAAALAGVATLAFEVLVARAAALRLGSSLFAWAWVLALFLLGLALGNAAFARRASRSANPLGELGLVEAGAAGAIAGGCALLLVPDLAAPARGAGLGALLRTAACVLPPVFLMGGAFPYLVRLGARDDASLGAAFGAVSAANTAGGIAGALLAPFVLLEVLGLTGAILGCAALNALLAAAFLLLGSPASEVRLLRPSLALLAVASLAWPALRPTAREQGSRVLFARDGRQASAVVLRSGAERQLVVDGEPEASTGGPARRTEELLAALPLALHPSPRRLLEVGLGSGITLATAARSDLEQIDCVEIAGSVMEAAPWFAPDNGPVSRGDDPRLRVERGDGRSLLVRRESTYDLVVANTVHPWSLGATGLYSLEYYGRVARALRDGGLAAQWVPLQRIGRAGLAAILRTFFHVFPEGGVWWGDENLILVGSAEPLRAPRSAAAAELGLAPETLAEARLGDAAAVREAVGEGPLLSDDRPRLEAAGARRGGGGGELELALDIARAGVRRGVARPALAPWIESLALRRSGAEERADALEAGAEAAGLALARRGRVERRVRQELEALNPARYAESARALRALLREAPGHRDARFGLARIEVERGELEAARAELLALTAAGPDDAVAWNLLGVVEQRRGDPAAARRAFAEALRADPFLHPALANAGLLAAASGQTERARALLRRLREASPLGPTPEERALREALGQAGG